MAVAPGEVSLLLATVLSAEVAIVAVLLHEILAVSTIFISVPGVVVLAVAVVVALVVMVVSSRSDWSYESGT